MKVLLGSALAALAMFIWGAAFWMSPIPYSSFSRVADDAAAGTQLLATFPESGVYVIPGAHLDKEKMEQLHKAGPCATIFINRDGSPVMAPMTLLLGYIHEFITVLLAAMLVKLVLPSLACYGKRVGFILFVGVVGSFFENFSNPIWMSHPWGYYLWNAFYGAVAWLLVGFILAAFVKPAVRQIEPEPAVRQAAAA